jgi:WD40 repeat protein
VDKTVRIWDPLSGECLSTLVGHTSHVYAVCSLSDGRIVSGGISIISSLILFLIIYILFHHIRGYECEDMGSTIWWVFIHIIRAHSLCACGVLTIWRKNREWIRYKYYLIHPWFYFWLFIFCSIIIDDKTVRIWDPLSGECLSTLVGNIGSVNAVCSLSDGRIVNGSGINIISSLILFLMIYILFYYNRG